MGRAAQHTHRAPLARSGAVSGVLPSMVGDGEWCAAVDGLVAVRGVLPWMSGNHFTSLHLGGVARVAIGQAREAGVLGPSPPASLLFLPLFL